MIVQKKNIVPQVIFAQHQVYYKYKLYDYIFNCKFQFSAHPAMTVKIILKHPFAKKVSLEGQPHVNHTHPALVFVPQEIFVIHQICVKKVGFRFNYT